MLQEHVKKHKNTILLKWIFNDDCLIILNNYTNIDSKIVVVKLFDGGAAALHAPL